MAIIGAWSRDLHRRYRRAQVAAEHLLGALDVAVVVRLLPPRPVEVVDAVVALAMAVEAAENKPAPVELLGWL